MFCELFLEAPTLRPNYDVSRDYCSPTWNRKEISHQISMLAHKNKLNRNRLSDFENEARGLPNGRDIS